MVDDPVVDEQLLLLDARRDACIEGVRHQCNIAATAIVQSRALMAKGIGPAGEHGWRLTAGKV